MPNRCLNLFGTGTELALNFKTELEEQDVFKLAIRGHALLEEMIDATISEAFRGGTPSELKRLPFRARLALLAALTPLQSKHVKALDALAQLRHDFAHGRLTELSAERAMQLNDEFKSLFSEGVTRKKFEEAQDPRASLVLCLIAAHTVIEVTANFARQQRDAEKRALKLQAGIKGLLAEQENQ